MKYIVIERSYYRTKRSDIFDEEIKDFDNLEEALKYCDMLWNHTTESEKKKKDLELKENNSGLTWEEIDEIDDNEKFQLAFEEYNNGKRN